MNQSIESSLSFPTRPAAQPRSRPIRHSKELATLPLVTMIVGVLVAAAPVFSEAAKSETDAAAAQGVETRVPAALDAFYPPAAEQPVFLFHMLSLDEAFTGIVVDVMEDDLSGAKDNYESFRTQYAEVRKLVPEWETYYPVEPVEKLGAAFASGTPGHLMAAFEEVGKTCHHCHVATMVAVQQRYHWGDFGSLVIEDPLSNESVDFSRFKQSLSANLTGIRVDLRQGQPENALRQFESFKARFEALGESCESCHERERSAYVSAEVQGLVEELGQVLRSRSDSTEAAATLLQGIGRESCSKCHLVHVPAALGKSASR